MSICQQVWCVQSHYKYILVGLCKVQQNCFRRIRHHILGVFHHTGWDNCCQGSPARHPHPCAHQHVKQSHVRTNWQAEVNGPTELFLSQAFLFHFSEGIPVARQETALEFWVCGCICLVFSALAEYAFILWNMVRLKRTHRIRNLLNIWGFS